VLRIAVPRANITSVGEVTSWLPARPIFTDATGTAWTGVKPQRLTEQDARRFVWRSSTRVAVEHSPGSPDVEWLDPAAQKDWNRHIAGHVEDGTGRSVEPNDDGMTYYASIWRSLQVGRMILISENC
jgi:hypothetical protein